MKVLHYKSNFLNHSETFIKRLIDGHQQFKPAAMCIEQRDFTGACPVFEKPRHGFPGLINTLCFHMNWSLPFYRETIARVEPDVIHAHFGFDGYRMIKPSKKTGVPLAVSFYGSDVTRLPKEFDWPRRYRKLARHGAAFIAASNLMKQQLVALGFPEEKIEVIRFGLNLNHFAFSESYSSTGNIMMVGRMVEKKGFVDAIEAVKILTEKGYSPTLDLYGDGILRDELERIVRQLQLGEHVVFHGQQPIQTIRRAYHTHSLLLVPSVTAADGDCEGIPNTLLEGIASGIPVIATNHSAIPEVITHKETGLLVDEKDPNALAEMIGFVKNENCNLTLLRQNARAHIEEYYDIHRMVEQAEAIYQRVLGDVI